MTSRIALASALLLALAAAACGGADESMSSASDPESSEQDLVQRVFMRVERKDLVSDRAGLAVTQDTNLVNPWGMAFNAQGGVWVSNAGTATSTVYNADGKLLLTVTVPGAPKGEAAAPTGQVFNTSTDWNGDKFIFADEHGTLSGWQPAPGTVLRSDQTSQRAVYKGLAMADHKLFVTDFRNGKIDVFDAAYAKIPTVGFVDRSIPAGYAPFNIQELGGKLYVTYAQQDYAREDDVTGPGKGFVNVFETDGTLIGRVASRGALNAPWGLALAPATFGKLAGKLLVGNFGSGKINAYDVSFATRSVGGGYYGAPAKTVTTVSSTPLGALVGTDGRTVVIPALWGITFSPVTGELFFTSGPDDEKHGLFGKLSVPAAN